MYLYVSASSGDNPNKPISTCCINKYLRLFTND